jgi:phosphoglycerol transferase MdoB-like AlkP superfamily enzyme
LTVNHDPVGQADLGRWTPTIFASALLSVSVTFGLFVFSWQRETSSLPLLPRLLMSVVVAFTGLSLVFHIRARSLSGGMPLGRLARAVALGVVTLGIAMAVASIWRSLQ